MKLFRHTMRLNLGRQVTARATERIDEAVTVRCEAEPIVAQSRSRAWVSASWKVVSGERVTLGDTVMVNLGSVGQGTIEGADPDRRLPLVRIESGPHQGQLMRLAPVQIMRRKLS